MNLITIIIRTIFFYFFIMIIYRVMGKREMGKLAIEDFVVGVLIAEMVAISIENTSDSIFVTVIPIALLVLFEVLLAYISIKSNKLRHFIEGKPSVIINNGKINFKEMVKQRYTLDDLLLELRSKEIKDISEVEYAILENNGKLSIFKYCFLNKKGNIPLPLILDGKVQFDTLKYLDRNELWLFDKLKKEGKRVENIFYGFYKNNKVYIISKEDVK